MSALSSAQLPQPGAVVGGKFRVERLLGQGGMGAVYAARHLKLGHAVAIKVMLAGSDNHESASRFVNEGRAAANIQSEHVLRVHDVDEENGYAYMILDLLEGEDLAQILDRERRLAPNVAVGYVIQALKGIREAHARGIVHRDLKPSNLFLARRQDGSVVVKVLDFGISKANNANPLGQSPSALTSTKAMLGSPLYMSPEQLRSSKNVDARADIWAVGVILHELVSGALPFGGENLGELFAKILEDDAPRLRTLVPDVPPGLEAIVARCLQRRPEHRFQSVVELERELEPFAGNASASPFAMSAVAPMSGGAPMPGASSSGRVLPGGQNTPSDHGRSSGFGPPTGAVPPGMTIPGGPPAGMPPPGATTGSGAFVPVVKGTAPLGAVTPHPQQPQAQGQPHAQTGNAWQQSSSGSKGSGGMIAAVVGSVVLAVVAVVLIVAYKGKHPKDGSTSAAGSSASAVAMLSATAPPGSASEPPSAAVATATPPVTPSTTTSAATSASAVPTAPSPHLAGAGNGRHGSSPPGPTAHVDPPEPPKVDPPRVDPPRTAAQPTRPPPTLSSGPLQGVR